MCVATLFLLIAYTILCSLMSFLFSNFTIDSHLLETIWTIVPIVIFLFIISPSFNALYCGENLSHISSPSVTVNVVANQGQFTYSYHSSSSWLFTSSNSFSFYESPSSSISLILDGSNRLILPSFFDINFVTTSIDDASYTFSIPDLSINIAVTPDRLNTLSTSNHFCDVYFGQCSNVCDLNPVTVPFTVEFVPAIKFVIYWDSLVPNTHPCLRLNDIDPFSDNPSSFFNLPPSDLVFPPTPPAPSS